MHFDGILFRAFGRQPQVIDRVRGLQRRLGSHTANYQVLNAFSRAKGGQVRFLQIGANDGLARDPVREFVVRDRWSGVLVEPSPASFSRLQSNYAYLQPHGLVFLQAAVGQDTEGELHFWVPREELRQQLGDYRYNKLSRKASFSREFVQGYLPKGCDADSALESLQVPILKLSSVAERYFPDEAPDLLVVDVEGHEESVFASADFQNFRPEMILYEHKHVGAAGDRIAQRLKAAGYDIEVLGTDAVARRR